MLLLPNPVGMSCYPGGHGGLAAVWRKAGVAAAVPFCLTCTGHLEQPLFNHTLEAQKWGAQVDALFMCVRVGAEHLSPSTVHVTKHAMPLQAIAVLISWVSFGTMCSLAAPPCSIERLKVALPCAY